MRSSLRRSARRGVTVLVGTAVFGLAASGAAEITTMVAHGAGDAQPSAYSMRAVEGERDGHGVATDTAMTIVTGPAARSIELLVKGDFCDFTPAC